MDLFRQGMKGPTRPAPTVPGMGVNRYSPVSNWDNDPFGADVFEPTPAQPHMAKKKPPPRPPPPKLKQPDIPAKPSHFMRKPTVLSSLLSRKTKTTVSSQSVSITQCHQQTVPDLNDLDTNRMFPKCEPKNVQMGALIDLSSPPSSPTFTTRSSSDGLSVDSFGSDATTSTNHHNNHNGNASQAESGFEDDFDLFLSSRKISKEDTLDNFAVDPFSPQPVSNKPPIFKKPVIAKDPFGSNTNVSNQGPAPLLKGPTIIRAKPARPKPPENSAILKTTFGNSFPVTPMTVNTTTPIHKVTNGFGDSFDTKPFSWDEGDCSPERESSPPMPSMPPPPPPPVDDDLPDFAGGLDDLPGRLNELLDLGGLHDLRGSLDVDTVDVSQFKDLAVEDEEPYAIALFDYHTDHPDDLCFSTNTRIKLLRRIDKEWLHGSLRNGAQGLFPSNYVEIKVPLPDECLPSPVLIGTAVAVYDFEPDQPGDLRFLTGDTISVLYKLNEEWYFGVCGGRRGQFPVNYVRMS